MALRIIAEETRMKGEQAERRAEMRWPIEAKAIVHKNNGESISAVGANISGAGMLLHVEQVSKFSVGEEVTVEVELKDNPDRPFSAWGLARIVSIDGGHFGLRLCAGIFVAGTSVETAGMEMRQFGKYSIQESAGSGDK
jgi:hypothetical protein